MRIDEDGLLLRPWQPDDADAVYRAAQDPLIPRYTTLPMPYQMSDAEYFVGKVAPTGWQSGSSANFAVLDPVTGELLGSCGLVWIRDGLAELGYWTAPWARGRGVALRASRLVCRYAFEDRGIARISWQAELGNQPSRLVALRCGFHIDGTWQFRAPNPGGLPDGWLGTLLPHQLSRQTPARLAAGSAVARRAALLFAGVPVLDLPDGLGRLRAPGAADLDAITAGCREPEVIRWTTVPAPYGRADAEHFVHGYARDGWARGTAVVFAIVDPDDRWLGSIDLRLDQPDGTDAEVGFLVAAPARGRGYATAALGTLCDWGFDALGLDRIQWRAEVGNHASRRVAAKCGFQEEGVARGVLPGRADRPADPVSGERRDRFDAWVGARLRDDGGRHERTATRTDPG